MKKVIEKLHLLGQNRLENINGKIVIPAQLLEWS